MKTSASSPVSAGRLDDGVQHRIELRTDFPVFSRLQASSSSTRAGHWAIPWGSLRKCRDGLEIAPKGFLWPCSRVAAIQGDAVVDDQNLQVLDGAALKVLEDEAGEAVTRFVDDHLLMLPARAARILKGFAGEDPEPGGQALRKLCSGGTIGAVTLWEASVLYRESPADECPGYSGRLQRGGSGFTGNGAAGFAGFSCPAGTPGCRRRSHSSCCLPCRLARQ